MTLLLTAAYATHCISIESIPPSSFFGQLPEYQSQVFSLIYQVDEFSFKKMKMLGQSNILTYCFLFGANQENQEALKVQDFLLQPRSGNLPLRQSRIWNPVKNHRWSSSVKTVNILNTVTVSVKKLHHGLPTGFHMGGLQVHGIRSCRLVYKEVVEALSNYKKSNFQ